MYSKNEEFTQQQGLGGRVVNIESVNRVLPGSMAHMVSSGVAANNILLVDPRPADDRPAIHAPESGGQTHSRAADDRELTCRSSTGFIPLTAGPGH